MADSRNISNPSTVNERILDQNIRHRLGLDQISGQLENEMVSLLNEADEDITRILNNRVPELVDNNKFLGRHLSKMQKEIRDLTEDIAGDVADKAESRVADIAENEVQYQGDLFKKAIPVSVNFATPSTQLIRSLVETKPFQGKTLRGWANSMAQDRVEKISNQVRLGVTEGESVPQIVNRVTGTRTASFRDGVLENGRRQTGALVRTAVTKFAEQARENVYSANDSLIKGVQYIATLDLRTTVMCASKDGEVYQINKGPRPPLHYQCRSTTSPQVKSWRDIGIDRDEIGPSSRASMNGQVPETRSFGDWLGRRDPGEVRKVLGKKRAKLWQEGNLNLDDFVRGNREKISLKELRVQQSEAFEKAGL